MTDKVAIVTDTTACIPKDLVARYNIEVVPVDYVFGDKVYHDGVDLTTTEFYALLRQAKKLPTTSGALPGPYLEAFRRASQRATSILCITLPAKLSGMFNSARVAMEMAKESRNDIIIEVVDCGTAAAGQGFVVLAAARAAASGGSLPEVQQKAQNVMPKVYLYAMLDTLHYLIKGGRVPRAAALVNSVLKIKPIFTIVAGEAYPVTIARSIRNGINHLVKIMREKVVAGQPLHVAVMHADALDKARALQDVILARFACTELFITEFTPVMGVHTGPGLIGVAFYNGD